MSDPQIIEQITLRSWWSCGQSRVFFGLAMKKRRFSSCDIGRGAMGCSGGFDGNIKKDMEK